MSDWSGVTGSGAGDPDPTDRPWMQSKLRGRLGEGGQPAVPQRSASQARAPLPDQRPEPNPRTDTAVFSQPSEDGERPAQRWTDKVARMRDAATSRANQKPAETTEPSPYSREANEAEVPSTLDAVKSRVSSVVKPEPERRVRKARLRLTKVDPWSVAKLALALSISFAIVLIVAVFAVWGMIEASSMFDSINRTVQSVVGEQAGSFRIQDHVSTNQVMMYTSLIAVVNVLLITALATVAAFLYNLAAALLGGVEVTFASDDLSAPSKQS